MHRSARLAWLMPLLALVACGQAGIGKGQQGLQAMAAQRGLRWGSAVTPAMLRDPPRRQLLLDNVGSITPENALKWDATEPQPGRFQFAEADALLAFSREHNLALRGHTLVWHEQLPAWLPALPTPQLLQALERHIRTVVGHGRGRIQAWDVINEPLDPGGNGLRQSIWLQRLGPGYLAAALRWARQADPAAILTMNDYGLEGDDPQTARKRRSLLTLIDELQRQGAPLDAIGLQAHLLAPAQGTPEFRSLPAFLTELRRRGLQLEITELDVSDRALPADPALRDSLVAATYDAFLKAVLTEPAVRRITSWGLSDRDTWLNQALPRADGLPQRPLPYDAALHAKPARSSIAARLQPAAATR
ncbi:MAG: endo-1,4-beta-xylanase [Vulcanococcus sp.]